MEWNFYILAGLGIFLGIIGLCSPLLKRIPQNPILGFRTRATLRSRRAWEEVHGRIALPLGTLGLSAGLVGFILAHTWPTFVALTVYGVVSLSSIWGLLWYYARLAGQIANEDPIAQPSLPAGRLRLELSRSLTFPWECLVWGIMLLTLMLTAYFYPQLPDQIPTHFDLTGKPDHWEEKRWYRGYGLVFIQLFMYIFLTYVSRGYTERLWQLGLFGVKLLVITMVGVMQYVVFATALGYTELSMNVVFIFVIGVISLCSVVLLKTIIHRRS